jgi:hypothetical protein
MHIVVHEVEAGVGRRSLEPKGGEGMMKQLVSITQRLLQSMDSLEHARDARCSILRASWLLHVDLLLEVRIQECCYYVRRVHEHV